MNYAQLSSIARFKTSAPASFNTGILLASVVLAIVFAIAIYMASLSPGTAADEFAAMTALP